ncbi:hypothetical protein SK128_007350 [Halocaridina rubra]|uniref:Uncharacterized protein n=1 Tax=Halocaridina rubra TaxID=373956 RepID=A0AAN8WBV8_HALRR
MKTLVILVAVTCSSAQFMAPFGTPWTVPSTFSTPSMHLPAPHGYLPIPYSLPSVNGSFGFPYGNHLPMPYPFPFHNYWANPYPHMPIPSLFPPRHNAIGPSAEAEEAEQEGLARN